MHQPMQGAQAQVCRQGKSFYDFGWNDYVLGIPFPCRSSDATRDYEDGWLDCRDATKKYGQQKLI